MAEQKHFSVIRPTIDTPYHIDFDWWKEHDNNWRVFLFSCLCPEHQSTFQDHSIETKIDWVDPYTAEIREVDGLQTTLINHCVKEPGFLTANTAMVDAIFRVFLSNGNHPMSPLELSDKIGKSADTILRTISGLQVYKGIRPNK
ncbi:MAG: hypothetical protein C0417_00195 [Chlorobiaceae bacterium]|nr:MAG: hypothetical protein FD147_169 [Chloroflexota bacterium]MBA4311034.1 hypothetical protein [Chlorobiaceae bacterium]